MLGVISRQLEFGILDWEMPTPFTKNVPKPVPNLVGDKISRMRGA